MVLSVIFPLLVCIVQNDKREKIVKASRDVTINSKKVIFQVHRYAQGPRD